MLVTALKWPYRLDRQIITRVYNKNYNAKKSVKPADHTLWEI